MRLLPLLAVLALVACGSNDGEAGSSAPTTPAAFEFTGYLFRTGGETRVCDAIRESYPPQCGGESYRVTGLDFSAIAGVQDAQGVSWTERPVRLAGVLADDGKTLMVSPHGVRADPPPPGGAGTPGGADG